jgi:hypothetical protein
MFVQRAGGKWYVCPLISFGLFPNASWGWEPSPLDRCARTVPLPLISSHCL